VFHLHNLAYNDFRAFPGVSAFLLPSEFARRGYARRLGLDGRAIPLPLRTERVVASSAEPRYVTFVNPDPAKGLTVSPGSRWNWAGASRDSLLVVEGRKTRTGLSRCGLDCPPGKTSTGGQHPRSPAVLPSEPYRAYAVSGPGDFRPGCGRGHWPRLPVLAATAARCPRPSVQLGLIFTLPPYCTPLGGVPRLVKFRPGWRRSNVLGRPAWEGKHRQRARDEPGAGRIPPGGSLPGVFW